MHDAAMPVAHVFAQANIRDDEQIGQFFFEKADGLLNDSILRISTGRAFVFAIWNAEQQHRRNTKRMCASCLTQQFIRRKLEHAGH